MEETYDVKKIKIALILNLITTILTIAAIIIMFTGFKFMYGYDPSLETTDLSIFKFFTVDSNVFVGIVSLIFAIYEIRILRGKIDEIPTKIYILKFMATTSVGLTFFVVFAYLGPIFIGEIEALLMNSNLFLHLLIPVTSMLNFTIFERTDKLKFKCTFLGVIPTIIYGIYYLTNIFMHVENGKVSTIYDWYRFVQNGIWTTKIVVPALLLITYIISVILWRMNKRGSKK